jgi:hypothetical protein
VGGVGDICWELNRTISSGLHPVPGAMFIGCATLISISSFAGLRARYNAARHGRHDRRLRLRCRGECPESGGTTRGGQQRYSGLAVATGADAENDVPLGPSVDRGADRLHHRPARSRSRGAGPHDVKSPDREFGHGSAPAKLRSRASVGGQYGAEALGLGRVTARGARQENTTVMAQACMGFSVSSGHWRFSCSGLRRTG